MVFRNTVASRLVLKPRFFVGVRSGLVYLTMYRVPDFVNCSGFGRGCVELWIHVTSFEEIKCVAVWGVVNGKNHRVRPRKHSVVRIGFSESSRVRQEGSGFQLTVSSNIIGVCAVVCVDALTHPLTMGQPLHVNIGVEAGPDTAGDYTHRCAEPCDIEVVGK